jgi:hypothetical protein
MSVNVAGQVVAHQADETLPAPWSQGVWFEGTLDPRGTAFAVLLALAATAAMVVIATALVRIATGA